MHKRLVTTIGLVLLSAVLLQGCGGSATSPPETPQATATESSALDAVGTSPDTPVALPEGYKEVAVRDGGAIKGVASFKGTPPPQGTIKVTKDRDVFGDTIPDESLIVSADGKIQNVVVVILDIKEGKPLPKTLPTITNKKGRFVAHAQAFPQRDLLIRSEDSVLHNTHPYYGTKEGGGTSLYNVAIRMRPGEAPKEVRRPLKFGAGMYQIRCDAHDWMRGWIWILDHPYGAVSGSDGTYSITDIPPGSYKVKAWHETLGEQQTEVTVKAGATPQVNFEFSR